MTYSERIADRLSAVIGSWAFILTQMMILVCWIAINVTGVTKFDLYPFILLNLFLSIQAAFTGPILLLSANRSAMEDRRRAMKNLVIDQQAHAVTMRMEAHIDRHMHELRKELHEWRTNGTIVSSNSQTELEHGPRTPLLESEPLSYVQTGPLSPSGIMASLVALSIPTSDTKTEK